MRLVMLCWPHANGADAPSKRRTVPSQSAATPRGPAACGPPSKRRAKVRRGLEDRRARTTPTNTWTPKAETQRNRKACPWAPTSRTRCPHPRLQDIPAIGEAGRCPLLPDVTGDALHIRSNAFFARREECWPARVKKLVVGDLRVHLGSGVHGDRKLPAFLCVRLVLAVLCQLCPHECALIVKKADQVVRGAALVRDHVLVLD